METAVKREKKWKTEIERVVVNGTLIRGQDVESVSVPGSVDRVWTIHLINGHVIQATGNVSVELIHKEVTE